MVKSGGGGTKGVALAHERNVKVVLLGDSQVGKSSLLVRFAENRWTPHRGPTNGIDFRRVIFEKDGEKITMSFWDTAGQEQYESITASYYKSAMGAMFVYDSTSRESLSNIRHWVAQVACHAEQMPVLMLVGNKTDMEPSDDFVSSTCGKALADEFGMLFLETSAKTGDNVREAFNALSHAICSKLDTKKEHAEPQPHGTGRGKCCRG